MVPAGRVFPPFLLLLLAWTFPTRVYSQQVNVSLVSTYYVEVTWVKTLLWLGVDDYNVSFTAESSNECTKTIHCSDIICTFNSLPCGVVSPCTNTTTTVAGDTYSAPPLSAVTGPEKVTNFAMNLEKGVEYISWVNPSMDSSPCYEETAVRVSFNGEDSISYFNHSQESTSKGLCEEGYGTVEVWTQGGDGHSNSSWEPIIYGGSGVVDVVTLETCEPVGCTSLDVEWSYAPVCPDVEYLSVEVGDVRQNVSTNTSNLTVTGLEVEKKYYTCIYARNKDGNVLQYSCMSYCETPTQVPENLTVKPLSTSALHFTWDPPVCQKPPVLYQLDIDYHYYTTTETEYIVDGLRSFYRYIVEVQVGQGYHYSDEKATMTAYTLPISDSKSSEKPFPIEQCSSTFSKIMHPSGSS